MSAPVTEAHRAITESVCELLDSEEMVGPSPAERAAQLIADREAAAVAEIAMVAAASADRNVSLRLDRDQLRAEVEQWELAFQEQYARAERAEAEVERLKKQIKDDNRSYGCELRDAYGTIWEQATKGHDRAGKAERALAELREWQAGVIANERLHHAERKEAIARAERAEAELADIRALANRRNKRDHSQDTTHQLVAALDQALDIAQAELAATKSTLDEEVNCAEKAEHEVVRQYARAERAEADADSTRERARSVANSLDEAQAELAAERARLDWFANYGDTCWHDQTMGVLRGEDGAEFYADSFRAAIDAAMKEGGK